MSVTVLVLPGVAGRKTAAVSPLSTDYSGRIGDPTCAVTDRANLEWSPNQDKISVLLAPPERLGAVFLAAFAGCILARQLLFSFRVESRTRVGRLATIAASAVIMAGTLLAIRA